MRPMRGVSARDSDGLRGRPFPRYRTRCTEVTIITSAVIARNTWNTIRGRMAIVIAINEVVTARNALQRKVASHALKHPMLVLRISRAEPPSATSADHGGRRAPLGDETRART